MKLSGKMSSFVSRKRNRVTLYLPFIYVGIIWRNRWCLDAGFDLLWWIDLQDVMAVLRL